MKIKIEEKYITFPVNTLMKEKKLSFYQGGELVFDIDAHIDEISPDFVAYVDVSRFAGMEFEVECTPEIDFNISQSSVMDLDAVYREPHRPIVHFSVKNGWNNDPNGLVKYKDIYHMFYQYNPCSAVWGNMHWGHAVSRDLLHWEELDIALFPDETGTMFSGGAFVDCANKTGLKENENDVMLLFYTAAGNTSALSRGKKFTQCLAYSADGGVTFKKYAGNPIVEHIEADNRDPKVVWCESLGKYLMAIFLDGIRFLLLVSDNLLDWTPLQEVSLPNDGECPDIFPLKLCDGSGKWVIMGASGMYAVGDFKDGKFCMEQPVKPLQYGRIDYAAQSFSGTGERCIRISWHRMNIPNSRFSQQMGFPVEMSLEKIGDIYYLCAVPVGEIAGLYSETTELKPPVQAGKTHNIKLDGDAYDIRLEADYLPGATLRLAVFGFEVVCDMEKNRIAIGGKHSPAAVREDKIDIRLIIDKCSIELFADGGKFCFCEQHISDRNIPSLALSCDRDITVSLRCSQLKSIWN